MSNAVISAVQLGAAHDGEAELVVTITYDNGGRSDVALDADAARHLFSACNTHDATQLIGRSWHFVRDALAHSSQRFQRDPDFLIPLKDTTHV